MSDLTNIHPRSQIGEHLSQTVAETCRMFAPHHTVVQIVEYDPYDSDTYPSVCQFPDEVASRFGFRGGEKLVFDTKGNYLGQLVKEMP